MAVFNQVVLSPDPVYLQPKSYDARADRKVLRSLISPGVELASDFSVSVVSGLQLAITAGVAYVLGQNVADQGMYRQFIAATVNVNVTAHHATLPRLDQVIMRIMDTAHDGSGFSEARIEVVPGNPTAGATLANRNGAANLATLGEASKSVLLLCDILVPATSGALTLADRRPRAIVGGGASASILSGAAFPTQGLYDGLLFRAGPFFTKRIFWTFMYDAGEDEIYKWKFVGGPDYIELDNAITVPLGGDYNAFGHHESTTAGSSSPYTVTIALRSNGVAVDTETVDGAGSGWGGAQRQRVNASVMGECNGLAASQVIDVTGGELVSLRIQPIRCI